MFFSPVLELPLILGNTENQGCVPLSRTEALSSAIISTVPWSVPSSRPRASFLINKQVCACVCCVCPLLQGLDGAKGDKVSLPFSLDEVISEGLEYERVEQMVITHTDTQPHTFTHWLWGDRQRSSRGDKCIVVGKQVVLESFVSKLPQTIT